MNWWVLGGWIGAVVVAVLVFGFCAYELTYRAKRLRTDFARLTALSRSLTAIQADVLATQIRVAAALPTADR